MNMVDYPNVYTYRDLKYSIFIKKLIFSLIIIIYYTLYTLNDGR